MIGALGWIVGLAVIIGAVWLWRRRLAEQREREQDAAHRMASLNLHADLRLPVLQRIAPKVAKVQDELLAPLTQNERESLIDLLEQKIQSK